MSAEGALPHGLNLLDPDFVADPWACYARWRRGPAVLRAMPGNIHVVHRHADVLHVLGNPRAFSSSQMNLAQRPWLPDDCFADMLVAMDPPRHGAYRRNAATAVGRLDMARIAASFVAAGGPLLDGLLARGNGDFIADFAMPMQAQILGESLGAPELADDVKDWVEALSSGPFEPEERRAHLTRTFADMRERLAALIAGGAARDGMVAMLAGRNADDGLGEAASLSFLGLWLVAGWETSIQLLANTALGWAEYPEACRTAAGSPAGRAAVVDEVLRLAPPVHAIDRMTVATSELSGETIPAGALVLAFVAAANRDPAAFPDPSRFDPARTPRGALSFGHGPHFCLGTRLATTLAAALLELLEKRRVRLDRLGASLAWRWTLSLRTLSTLSMRFARETRGVEPGATCGD